MLIKRYITITIGFMALNFLYAQDIESCMECHSDDELETERGVRKISLYVDQMIYQNSVHSDLECITCHADADVEDFPHPEQLEPVYCGDCHDQVQLDFEISSHGQALSRNAIYAPDCAECHGKHDIQSKTNPESPTYKMSIPFLCGKCHQEGAPVANVYNISEHNINVTTSIDDPKLFFEIKGNLISGSDVSD